MEALLGEVTQESLIVRGIQNGLLEKLHEIVKIHDRCGITFCGVVFGLHEAIAKITEPIVDQFAILLNRGVLNKLLPECLEVPGIHLDLG